MSDVSNREKQDEAASDEGTLRKELYQLLQHMEDSLEMPMLALAFV